MERNEVKKALYKQKPLADLLFVKDGNAVYQTFLEDSTRIVFEVPVSDMGDASFYVSMDAKLLIRWIKE